MKLLLARNKNFISPLYIDGNQVCLIIENPELAIPAGNYPIELMYSPRFQRYNPHIIVPGRSGIEMHTANYYSSLEGCLGTGTQEEPGMTNPHDGSLPWVSGSIQAYNILIARMIAYAFNDPMAQYDPMTITITDPA
jgi:hypothetical protein